MSKADLVVLGFLNHKPMHGYEIVQWLKIHHLDKWAEVKLPSVYKSLQRLDKRGFIQGKIEYDGNKPPRTVYQINQKGITKFRKLVKQFLGEKTCTSKDFWSAIAMMQKGITKEDFLYYLGKRIENLQHYYQSFLDEIKQMKNDGTYEQIPYYDLELMNMGKKVVSIELESLKKLETLTKLEKNDRYFLEKEMQ